MSTPEPEQDSVLGRMPILLDEREYGTVGAHTTCFAYAVATWCFLTGGYVAELVGAVQGIVCLVAGTLIGLFVTTMPLSIACQRYGLEQIDACKPAFGQRGAQLMLIFYLINMLGWSGLILVMFGNGLHNIAQALGYEPGRWVVGAGVALGLWLSYLIVTRGVHLLNLANSIITPGLGLLVGFMLVVLLRDRGWETILAAEPLAPGPTPFINYMIALELGIAGGISWWGGIGFLARNTRSRRNAIYPELLQLGLAGALVCCVGLFSALVVRSNDPTEWMVPIGGVFLGVLALGFVALANVTSTAVSLFASGLALRHVPGLREMNWKRLMLLTIAPCVPFVFWPHELYDLGDAFLAYNGTMYAPIVGIVFVDFFVLRRQQLSLFAIFEGAPSGAYHYSHGFHWPALASLVLGQGLYLFLYNPITGETHDLFQLMPASVAACVVPALTYWLATRLMREAATADVNAPRHLVEPNI
ncbi:MAG: cytosine permease [Myxococcales bacterium]|nr:cytosine permease [Myxococcales bacterium]